MEGTVESDASEKLRRLLLRESLDFAKKLGDTNDGSSSCSRILAGLLIV